MSHVICVESPLCINPPAELVEAVGVDDAAVEEDEEIIEAALAGAHDMFPGDLS